MIENLLILTHEYFLYLLFYCIGIIVNLIVYIKADFLEVSRKRFFIKFLIFIVPYEFLIIYLLIKYQKDINKLNHKFIKRSEDNIKKKIGEKHYKTLQDLNSQNKKNLGRFFPSLESIIIFLIGFFLLLVSFVFFNGPTEETQIAKQYKDQIYIKDFLYEQQYKNYDIVTIGFDKRGSVLNYFQVVEKDKITKKISTKFVYKYPYEQWHIYQKDLYKIRSKFGIGFYIKKQTNWISIIGSLLYGLIIGFILYFLIKQSGFSLGNTKDNIKRFNGIEGNKVSFNNIGGIESIKDEITETINVLKNWNIFKEKGVRLLRGILFYGPPGVGKTMIAKAIASELGINMFIATGNDFRGPYLGQGAKKVHDTFKRIRKQMKGKFDKIKKELGDNELSILFIDEIDTVFKKRGSGHSEDDTVVNAFLHEMDGINGDSNIIVIGATNHIDQLDEALLSRIDKKIAFKLPTRKERLDIIKKILSLLQQKDPTLRVKKKINLNVFSANTLGLSGRDLDNILNDVHRHSIIHNKEINESLIQQLFSDYILGKDNTAIDVNENDKKVVTYHELGHGVIGFLNGKQVHTITIIPKGPALGLTWSIDGEEKVLRTPDYILKEIQGLVAGRIAESIWLGEITTGSSNDYERATHLAFSYFKDYNFEYKDCQLGYIINSNNNTNQIVDVEIHKKLEREVEKLIKDQELIVKETLLKYKTEINKLAKILIKKELIEEKDLIKYLEK